MPRLLIAFLISAIAAPAVADPIALIPQPQHVVERSGGFTIDARTTIAVPPGDAGAANAAARLSELLGKTMAVAPRVAANGAVRFVRRPGMTKEAYRLDVNDRGATITASDDGGLLYGAVTLWQLADKGRVPAVTIDDAPRFGWRGLMLDSARHFQSPAFIHRLIDAMAASKLNTLHWHLVDDQGWRIPIDGYPRLTTISAWRHPATAPGAPQLPRVGGFYTKAQIREIVAYAAARNITVVPEIEMPGHALAAIRAYSELGMGVPIPLGTESDWGVFPWLYNTDETTFRFLETVLDQVMELFPSTYIHIGGDEATKEQWKASPKIQAQIKALGLKNENELQSWFVKRIGTYLAKHDRKLIGWDEILEGGITPGATVMSWRGIDGAVAAAKAGHDTVLSPAPILYLDNKQGDDAMEGPGRGNLMSLDKVYGFDPAPNTIPREAQRHILGVQGNLWTEHVRTEERAAAKFFPRAAAIAELGWSPAAGRDYDEFVKRLARFSAKIDALGIVGSRAIYRPLAVLAPSKQGGTINLSGQTKLPIRYTLDGSTPTGASPAYSAAINAPLGARLRAATFLNGTALPGAIDLPINALSVRHRDDTQLTPCTSAVPLRLEDDAPATGRRAAFFMDIFNPCWIHRAVPMDGVDTIEIEVGQVPFNFQVGHDADNVRFREPSTPAGEFEVRDGCKGERIAVLPLAKAAANPGISKLRTSLPAMRGEHDLCITYTARGLNPLWGVSSVQLVADR